MKNLANCTVREFLAQSNKIRKSVNNWLTLTKVLEIRKHQPDIPDDATVEERKEITQEQVKKNLSEMLDAILDEYPEETAELLGLLCFIEPKDLDNYKMTDLLSSFTELLESEEVISFFTSLAKLGNKSTRA